MKTYKKLVLGAMVLLAGLSFGFAGSRHAFAAGFTATQINNARAYFVSRQVLSVVIAGQSYEFDSNVSDPTATTATYKPKDPAIFCQPANTSGNQSYLQVSLNNSSAKLSGTIASGGLNDPVATPESVLYAGTSPQNCTRALPSDKNVTFKAGPPPAGSAGAAFTSDSIGAIVNSNFKFTDGANISLAFNGTTVNFNDQDPQDNNRNFTPPGGAFCTNDISGITFDNANQSRDPLPATLQLAYYDAANSNTCTKKTINLSLANPNKIATQVLEWDGTNIQSLGGSLVLSPQSGSQTIYLKDPTDICGGGWVVQLASAGGNSGTLYQVSSGSGAGSIGLPSCSIDSQRSVLLSGTQGKTAPTSGTGGSTTPSCESNSSFGFEWIMCPFLHLMDSTAGAFTQFINNQMCFNTGQSSTGGVSCPGQNNLTVQVERAWSVFRIIASALLVVVMLVMVISQAFGGGLFDAYTIRKLLPKLVAAVILIQLSWVILKWGIDLSNDLGKGISDLMYAPFGGQSNTDLAKLIGNQVKDATGSETGADAFSVFFILAGAAAFYISLPSLAILALYTVAALFTGFLVLVFRKLLIITLVMLAPIALVLWILPGTENYWKLWKDNFVKLLLMFPIISALIAGGRIFAYIAAGSPSGTTGAIFSPHLAIAHIAGLPVPYVASVTDFATLAIIIAAFFGPFFLLPKAFSWGGGLMGSVSKGAESFRQRAVKKPAEVLQERKKGWQGERTRKSQERVARGEGFNKLAPWRYPVDKAKSGQWDPTQGVGRISIGGRQIYGGSRRREHAISQYVAKGTESEEAEIKAADAKFKPAFDEAADHDQLSRDIAAGGDVEYTTKSGEVRKLGHMSLADRQAGLNAVLKYGGGTNMRFLDTQLDQLNIGNPNEQVMAEKFRNANSQALLPKLKHVYFAPGVTRDQAIDRTIDNGITESAFAGMDTVEMESMLESLSNRAAAGDAAAAGRLSTVLTTYQAAISNDTIRPSIDIGLNKAVEAFVDGHNLVDINTSRATLGLPGINRGATTHPSVAPVVSGLAGRIDTTGRIQAAAAAAPPHPPNPRADWFRSVGDYDIANLAARVGGYSALTDDDLQEIYNRPPGTVKTEAENELRNRGLIP